MGHVARTGEERNASKILVGQPARKRYLGRLRCRCEDNIKIDLEEIGLEDVDWIYLAQDMGQWRILMITILSLRVS
jgi:hypothetical protein